MASIFNISHSIRNTIYHGICAEKQTLPLHLISMPSLCVSMHKMIFYRSSILNYVLGIFNQTNVLSDPHEQMHNFEYTFLQCKTRKFMYVIRLVWPCKVMCEYIAAKDKALNGGSQGTPTLF